MDKTPEKDRKSHHLFYAKKRTESFNSKLKKSPKTSNETSVSIDSIKNSNISSNFSLGDVFSLDKGEENLVINKDIFVPEPVIPSLDQTHSVIHAKLIDVKRQEKEVKQQIESFRLDSWHYEKKNSIVKTRN